MGKASFRYAWVMDQCEEEREREADHTSACTNLQQPLPNNRTQKSGTLEVIRTPSPVYQLGAACVRMDGATLGLRCDLARRQRVPREL